jgi:hypothetical protein
MPGFGDSNCKPIQGDGVALPVEREKSLSTGKGTPVQREFQLKDAQLYAAIRV